MKTKAPGKAREDGEATKAGKEKEDKEENNNSKPESLEPIVQEIPLLPPFGSDEELMEYVTAVMKETPWRQLYTKLAVLVKAHHVPEIIKRARDSPVVFSFFMWVLSSTDKPEEMLDQMPKWIPHCCDGDACLQEAGQGRGRSQALLEDGGARGEDDDDEEDERSHVRDSHRQDLPGEQACSLFREMIKSGYASPADCLPVVESSYKKCKIEMVWSFIKELPKLPDCDFDEKIIYSLVKRLMIWLGSCFNCRTDGVPDTRSSLVRAGSIGEAYQLSVEMMDKGYQAITYIIVQILNRDGKMNASTVTEAMTKLKEKGKFEGAGTCLDKLS
ncbi:hypothetical protein SELMODRAFT_404259 [Selaginella moellendorffii]|uniref:Uncharacterized protein n=1 Tax=Selaginella moellendorffii TaxID=88036 RepID=D8QUS5_SELML|nr:hypothetical protein SELMODRAFT_404259 [Selaginella moellendorffii]